MGIKWKVIWEVTKFALVLALFFYLGLHATEIKTYLNKNLPMNNVDEPSILDLNHNQDENENKINNEVTNDVSNETSNVVSNEIVNDTTQNTSVNKINSNFNQTSYKY